LGKKDRKTSAEKTMIKKIRSSKAFTLIEMLIVVAIIGILVGIGVPALRNARADAQNRKADSVLANVATAKARFELDAANNAAITAFNTSNEGAKFTSLQPYLLVNGAPVASLAALVDGTGRAGININNLATYAADGTVSGNAVPPDYDGAGGGTVYNVQ
jgi:prepilin-type N-terminal cleavage/methylation domain-containing protein